MTAFGPYKDTEVIDFSELGEHQLFVISGATGAGKTTIFDGISFALYGSASGTDRESTAMLRSHFAEDNVHTAVELTFELKGKTYRILRQLGHQKKGNKTATGDKYEFYERIDGSEVPCVDRQMVSEINQKVEQIIGLTQDQFKQIVMLPQGEFRKLLTSETENKEEILRRLFKTERYQQMNVLLKARRDDVESQFKNEQNMLQQYMNDIVRIVERREDAELFQLLDSEYYQAQQIIPALQAEALFYEEKIKTEAAHVKETNKQLEAKREVLFQAKTTNERLNILQGKKVERQELEKETTAIKQKEQALEAAERASKLEPYEAQVTSQRKEQQAMVEKQQQVNKQFQQITNERETIQQQYNLEEKKATEREKMKQQVQRLQEYLPRVREIDSTKQTMSTLHEEMTKDQAALEKVTETGRKASNEIEALKQATMEQPEVMEKLQQNKLTIEKLRYQHKQVNQFIRLQQEQREATVQLDRAKHVYDTQKQQYNRLEASWLDNQAFMLAEHLHDGSPCPVCGSEAHPNKVTAQATTVSREDLDQEKNKTNALYEDYTKKSSRYEALKTMIADSQQALAEEKLLQENMEHQRESIVQEGKEMKQQMTKLETSLQTMKEQQEKQRKLEEQVADLLKQKEIIDTTLREKHTRYTSLKAAFTERIREIPEEMQVLKKLEATLMQTEKQSNELEKNWLSVQEALRNVTTAFATEKANQKNINLQVKQMNEKVEQSERVFRDKVIASNFTDVDMYHNAKLSEKEQIALRQEITIFKETVVSLDKQINDLTEELAGKQLVDLEALEAEVKKYNDIYEKALNQYHHAQNQLKIIADLKEKITNVAEQTKELEKRFALISDLYDVLRGQTGRKISFERYVQIDYLDQITAAANQRFRKLSNGQYQLVRSDRQETHGRQSGLAIDVHDAYTGQNRDVKTLSGGEKFIASLCLALGMSDVIQSFQGNISMDTMFIDEGFGSLDEESLYKAIDALINIQQSGRMIGIISHVEELKSIFPAMLSVEKTKEGFSKTAFVLK